VTAHVRPDLANPPTAIAGTSNLETLVAAAAAEEWGLDLEGAVLDDSGWENVVLVTRDGWIIRFPRDEAVPFAQEIDILRRMRGRLPAAIPVPVHVGSRVRVMAYRKITGAAFDDDAYRAAGPMVRDRLAASLADFLVAVHSVAPDDATPRIAYADIHQLVFDRISLVPPRHRDLVTQLATRYARTWVSGAVPGPQVLLHNDFHLLNMVFRAPVGGLAGVWDFSCVAVGAPTFDLRYFDRAPHDLLVRLADAYEARTGRVIDLPAAILARRVEDVHDALVTGRMDILDAAVHSWSHTDRDRPGSRLERCLPTRDVPNPPRAGRPSGCHPHLTAAD
jgi:aminoglycoside phosphotransferase (APT) family kinase protein